MRPKIIDVHVHTSDREMHGLHTADASLQAIENAADQFAIEKLFVLATYFPFKGSGLHNHRLLERLAGHSRFGAIGSLDVMNAYEEGVAELLDLCQRKQLVGIKLYPGYQPFEVGDSKMFLVYGLAETFHLPVTIHGGELHHCCSAKRRQANDLACKNAFCWIDRLGQLAHPDAFKEAIRAFPNVTFVIAHLANPYFGRLRKLMCEFPNVVTDISGQYVSGTHEDTPEYRAYVRNQILLFLTEVPNGEDRVLFGSDFPIQSFEDSIDLIEKLPVSEQVKAKIFRHNALRVYAQAFQGGVQ